MIREGNGRFRPLGAPGESRHPADFFPVHTLRGRTSYSREDDEVGFVIDGRFLSLSEFAKLVETYEGWQFRLEFLDGREEVR